MVRSVLLVLSCALASAFQVSPLKTFRPMSSLPVSSVPGEQTESVVPTWTDLPSKETDTLQKDLDEAEIGIGRIAMVGAIGILARELMTGESILEQFIDTVQTFAH